MVVIDSDAHLLSLLLAGLGSKVPAIVVPSPIVLLGVTEQHQIGDRVYIPCTRHSVGVDIA